MRPTGQDSVQAQVVAEGGPMNQFMRRFDPEYAAIMRAASREPTAARM
jgi:hypothetical protein